MKKIPVETFAIANKQIKIANTFYRKGMAKQALTLVKRVTETLRSSEYTVMYVDGIFSIIKSQQEMFTPESTVHMG